MVRELPKSSSRGWQAFGPFERAWDHWGDGSLWLIDAPGHAPGNLIAAARLENGHWIVMGGDCAHSK
jgi:glyoxylase-like metal-dependent hydrolase (beta-lactamase superfamily II)